MLAEHIEQVMLWISEC